jgi:anti-anti-sigma factor
MNSSSTIKAESFTAHYEEQGDRVVVSMRGNADMAVHERVKAFLDALDQAVRAAGAKEAVFELAELYFMNSSCLSLLLRFINGIVAQRAGDQYKVRFRSNQNLRWQRKSLAALRAYAPDLVVIE